MHFGNDPKPGDNRTRPIFVENDEYVVNRNASRKFKPLLDTLNFVVEPRFDNGDTAHSAIDEAIAMNFLSEMGMQEGGAIEEFKPSGALLRSFGLAGPPMLKTSGVTEEGKLRPDISTAKMAGFMEGMDRLGNLHGIRDNLDRAREMENEKMNRKRLMGDIEMMGDSLIDTDDKYLMDKTEFDYLASVPDSDKMGQQARMFELDRELSQMKADDMRKNELMKDIQLLGDVEVPEMPNFQDFSEASYRDGEFIPESLPRVISLGQENELLDIAKQSMAKQKEMENLSSLLSSNIISQMSENIPEQEIRRSSESPIDNISYSLGYQKGGYIDRVVKSDSLKQALLDKPMIDYFTRGEMKSTKNKPLGIIQKRVLSGELEPEDGLNMLLNFEKMNYMKSKGDTTNVLFDTLKEAGYQEGGAVQDKTRTNTMDLAMLRSIADKSPQYSMFDADSRGGVFSEEDILGISEGNFIPAAGVLSKGYAGIFGSGDVPLSKIKDLLKSGKFNKKQGMGKVLYEQSPVVKDFFDDALVSEHGVRTAPHINKTAKELVNEAKKVYKDSQEKGFIESLLKKFGYFKEYQGGGRIKGVDEFPVGGIGVVREQLSEDKRDRKGGYSLGVKDYYAQALGEFEKMGDFVGGATGSNRRNILEAAQEAGAIMETQEALDALKLIANRHQQGTMGVMANPRKGYQYGGQTTTDYYQTYGQQFSDADEQQKFEELYGTFDPTEFLQQRGELAEAGQSALLRGLTQSTQQAAKSGLNIGAGQTPNYMKDAYKTYESGTQNILNQQLQQQEADALAYLAEADLGGADMEENPTMTSEQSSLPQFNTVPTEYVGGNIMVNLTQYKWDSEAEEYVKGVG